MEFSQRLESIPTYEAGKPIEEVMRTFGLKEGDIIKLASNENPYGTSPRVIEAIQANAHKAALYPDDSMYALKSLLAKRFNISQEQCIIGSGSDQIIELCLHAKADPNSVILTAGTTFAMYAIYAKQVGATTICTSSSTHNLAEFYESFLAYKPSIIFLCVPNNPLGECLGRDEVFAFLEKIQKESQGQTLVVLDGAYQEFASYKDKSKQILPSEILERFSNVIYLGTFSKAYGLGGMRVGYGVANQEIIQALYKLRPPFNVTTLSLVAACAALEDEAFVRQTIEQNFEQMCRYEKFAESNNIRYIPSFTNFITYVLDVPYQVDKISEALLAQGVIIRSLASYKMNAMRITIGTQAQNTKVLSILERIFCEYA